MINTHSQVPSHIYLQSPYENAYEYSDYMNKLFCTFSSKEDLDTTLAIIQGQYKILFNKIFILYIKSTEEYVFTYNVDSVNMTNALLDNTILLHRKKESNTLYTINALNDLIKSLNGGVLDNTFPIDWKEYQNCILLTHSGDLRKLETKIYKIITL
ncbi:hypothetical protein N9795_01110 [Candidatus Pelagibacter sp.]|nr:hypothetical protein [Candidatus Pelagibacter sp.]